MVGVLVVSVELVQPTFLDFMDYRLTLVQLLIITMAAAVTLIASIIVISISAIAPRNHAFDMEDV